VHIVQTTTTATIITASITAPAPTIVAAIVDHDPRAHRPHPYHCHYR
jgi:hypothetical protein